MFFSSLLLISLFITRSSILVLISLLLFLVFLDHVTLFRQAYSVLKERIGQFAQAAHLLLLGEVIWCQSDRHRTALPGDVPLLIDCDHAIILMGLLRVGCNCVSRWGMLLLWVKAHS